ncbi:two component sensor histidine kinase ChvG [Neoasaia chiangmaiensis NBRC 101099]|nr:two component sensor histidine kinase ChvG [Neoasaia chiangmaiensis NBRC 101099]GEN14374.1 histidine kinase [Neoasaia chiangmaiensis]
MASPREKLLNATRDVRRERRLWFRARTALRRLIVSARQHRRRDADVLADPAFTARTPGRRAMARLRRPRLASPLMRRIFLLNTLPLAMLAVTLLFLNDFQNSLLEADVTALREQAHIYANAIGQTAVVRRPERHPIPGDEFVLDAATARPLLLRLTEPSPNAHARLVGPDGKLVADSRDEAALAQHERRRLRPEPASRTDPAPNAPSQWEPPHNNSIEVAYDWLLSLLPLSSREGIVTLDTPDAPTPDPDTSPKRGANPPEAAPYIRRTSARQLVVTVAEPVVHEGQTVGVIQLTRQAQEVDRSLFAVRSSIVSLFLVAMAVTLLLSWYLSLTIARPLLRLAAASHDMRDESGRVDSVPEPLLARRDEIGVLARALRASVLALWARMDAIERFAADVSHEIKNPLSSIRSAIETLPRIENRERQQRLLGIISNDVRRLDRLITDISDASRIDAELSRTRPEPLAVMSLLAILVEIHQTTRAARDPILKLEDGREDPARPLKVLAVEDRLVQVLRNLIGNAASFSPPLGVITLRAIGHEGWAEIIVDDQGPGIPDGKLEDIFDRFYSERPQTENFGQHSGLGLAISRQIIDALHGTLHAENRYDAASHVLGARFVVRLPRSS